MKLDARRIDAFLRDPGDVRVVLLHGEDVGLIRARAAQLVRGVAGTSDDPFRVSELDRESLSSIPAELASLSLFGGRRVIRVRDAADAAAGPVQQALAGRGSALLVLEAVGLPPKGKLRPLLEKAPDCMVIACYRLEGRQLEQAVRAALQARAVTIDEDALAWLAGQLGADHQVMHSEIDKLANYVGEGGRVDLDAARICVGDLAGLSLDDALFAATAGDVEAADRALELAMAEGAAPVSVLRAGLLHMQRLQRARAAVQAGSSVAEAAKSVRPPVFFRREAAFVRALEAWRPQSLQEACTGLWENERASKRTGAPAESLARRAIIGLAQRAAASRGR